MLALLLTQAYALSCIDGLDQTNLNTPLPPNGVIVYSWVNTAPAVPVILDPAGNEVPAKLVEHNHHAELIPDEPLVEGEYVFVTEWEMSFTVAGPEDHDAPSKPVFVEVEREIDRSEWGTSRYLSLSFDPLPEGEHLEIEISDTGDWGADARIVSMYSEAWMGEGLCGTVPAVYDHGADYFLRARAVDAAGNASPWVEHEPASRGLGVGCTTSGAPMAGLLPLLGLLGLRRRR